MVPPIQAYTQMYQHNIIIICSIHLEDEAEVAKPLCVLQRRVPLAAGHGETESPQGVVALPHGMDVGDGQVLQLGSRVAGDDLGALTLYTCRD